MAAATATATAADAPPNVTATSSAANQEKYHQRQQHRQQQWQPRRQGQRQQQRQHRCPCNHDDCRLDIPIVTAMIINNLILNINIILFVTTPTMMIPAVVTVVITTYHRHYPCQHSLTMMVSVARKLKMPIT